MTKTAKDLLPKQGWWENERDKSVVWFAEELARIQEQLRSAPSGVLDGISWTHDVVVENADAPRAPGYFCGGAAQVETMNFFGQKQRLACWFVGSLDGHDTNYGFVPSAFVLVPRLYSLAQQVLEVAVGLGFCRVAREAGRPNKNQFWLELDGALGSVLVQFHTWRSSTKARNGLRKAGIFYDEMATECDIVVRPIDNILR